MMVRFVQGEDVSAVLPTRFGKSLCYTCPPGMFDALHDSTGSVAIVIRPDPLALLFTERVSTPDYNISSSLLP